MNKKLATVVGVIAISALTMSGCQAGDSDSASDKLVVTDYGGASSAIYKKYLYEPFEEANDVTIEVVSPTDRGKLKAMEETGNVSWDVVFEDSFWAKLAGDQGLLEKIDYDVVDADDIDPAMNSDYGVGFQSLYYTIASSAGDEDRPVSWSDFYDVQKFPGDRAMYKGIEGLLESALLADGVKKEDLYPLDVDRAFKKLDKFKPDVKVWWENGSQPAQLLDSGEVKYAMAWSARIEEGKTQGLKVENDYTNAIEWYNAWMIPKGAPNKELAMEFIDFAVSADVQADIFSELDYAPANSKAIDKLPADKRKLFDSIKSSGTTVQTDVDYWAENFDSVTARFNEWILS